MASRKSAPPPVASEPDVLGRLYREVSASLELVGERESFCLTYLAAQTRRSGGGGKPAGVTAYGQSSAGKTVSQDLALSFVRPEDVWSITDLSVIDPEARARLQGSLPPDRRGDNIAGRELAGRLLPAEAVR
jgi:hypothetical protein